MISKSVRLIPRPKKTRSHQGKPSAMAGRRRHQRQAQTVRVSGQTVRVADLVWRYDTAEKQRSLP
jgi:hypothetical protein